MKLGSKGSCGWQWKSVLPGTGLPFNLCDLNLVDGGGGVAGKRAGLFALPPCLCRPDSLRQHGRGGQGALRRKARQPSQAPGQLAKRLIFRALICFYCQHFQ
jgi:hypothetical protein